MRDKSSVEPNLVLLLRELSRRAGRPASDDEVRAALAGVTLEEEAVLREYAQGEPPARPLSAMAWVDIARGSPPETAAARELTGYYDMQAERDALAQVLRAKESFDEPADRDDEPEPVQIELEHRKLEKKPMPPRDRKARAQAADEEHASRLLTLFAYHRDTPLVAKALGWSLSELDAEVDRLSLRRKTGKLLRGLDTELPAATARKGASSGKSAPVRRRSLQEKADAQVQAESVRALKALSISEEKAAEIAEPAPLSKRIPGKSLRNQRSAEISRLSAAGLQTEGTTITREPSTLAAHVEARAQKQAAEKRERLPVKPSAEQGDELRAILREVGPRRGALAARLGSAGKPLSPAALLARFRAAGLEREFGQRERDLVRALISRHRSSLAAAASELGMNRHELEQLVKERGLKREVDEQREKQKTTARAARWPKARIALVLEKREWLADLGLYDELQDDVRARAKLIWKELAAGDDRLQPFADALGIKLDEARALAQRLSLR